LPYFQNLKPAASSSDLQICPDLPESDPQNNCNAKEDSNKVSVHKQQLSDLFYQHYYDFDLFSEFQT